MEPQTITISDTPTMPGPAVRYLRKRLAQTRCFLEYGAGGSTVVAARAGVPRIYSVESDPAYVQAVEAKVASIVPAERLRAVHIDIGPTGRFGHPVDQSGRERWKDYPALIWDIIAQAGDAPDTILVDGRFRVACFLRSMINMPAEALILFDDYGDREDRYGVVTAFTPVLERVGRLAIFGKPAEIDRDAVDKMYREHLNKPA